MCQVKFFSDNLLFVSEIEKQDEMIDFLSLLNSVADYQINLALKGFFVRGIILADTIYCDETFVFGPAILRAQELEKERVKYPRILIEKQYIEFIQSEIKKHCSSVPFDLYNEFLEDEDGNWYLNYLFPIDSRNDWIKSNPLLMNEKLNQNGNSEKMIDFLKVHKNNILNKLENLHNYDFSVHDKYQWLGQYHNYFCRKYFSKESELIIDNISSNFLFKNPIEKMKFK